MDKPRSLCIFVIDDEPGICLALQEFLEELQHQIFIFSNAEEALQRLPYEKPDLVLMDIRLPGISGVEALREFQKLAPKLPLILMTAYGTIETALEAMKAGAFEYLLKPLPNLEKVEELIQQAYLRSHQTEFPPATALNTTSRIIGHSLKMQEVFKQIALAVSSSANVLIQGESGTGKELVARAIHDHSPVQKGPYCIVNCATLTSSLFENELYGHESGAYTGALRPKIGKVEMADQGTLFLDEIGEIPFEHQAKLLRFLETKTFERVGGTKSLSVQTRIVAATNQNLEELVQEQKFRKDLFYRLNAFVLRLPPLRERPEDIPFLLNHFLSLGSSSQDIDPRTLKCLQEYSWPGNIRELKQVIEHAALLAGRLPISPHHLPLALQNSLRLETKNPKFLWDIDQIIQQVYQEVQQEEASYKNGLFEPIMARFEKALLRYLFNRTHGNQSLMARQLGLHRTTLRNKLKLYELG